MSVSNNLTGQVFGRWTALYLSERKSGRKSYWECMCSCGTPKSVRTDLLLAGTSKSCGCLNKEMSFQKNRKDLEGKIFGRLKAIRMTGNRRRESLEWECLCDCGNTTLVTSTMLFTNRIKSCGCLRKETLLKVMTKHGLSRTSEYKRFHCAKRRARKLKATPKWSDLEKIKEFYNNCPNGYQVDHIVPLKNKLVCGLHVENNLQYLTKSENCSKNNSFEII